MLTLLVCVVLPSFAMGLVIGISIPRKSLRFLGGPFADGKD